MPSRHFGIPETDFPFFLGPKKQPDSSDSLEQRRAAFERLVEATFRGVPRDYPGEGRRSGLPKATQPPA